jgi:hypothetical protein
MPVTLVIFERNLYFLDRLSKKSSNIKFHENPFNASRDAPCGWTDGRTDGQTDMMKLKSLFVILLTSLKTEYGEEIKFIQYSPQEVSKYVTSPALLSESETKQTNKRGSVSHNKSQVNSSIGLHTITLFQKFSILSFGYQLPRPNPKLLAISIFKLINYLNASGWNSAVLNNDKCIERIFTSF